MTLNPFPAQSHMRWRRVDVPGREEARIERIAHGWRLTGELEVEVGSVSAQLEYLIECEPDWRTRRTMEIPMQNPSNNWNYKLYVRVEKID